MRLDKRVEPSRPVLGERLLAQDAPKIPAKLSESLHHVGCKPLQVTAPSCVGHNILGPPPYPLVGQSHLAKHFAVGAGHRPPAYMLPHGRPEPVLLLGAALPPRPLPRHKFDALADTELYWEPISVFVLLARMPDLCDPEPQGSVEILASLAVELHVSNSPMGNETAPVGIETTSASVGHETALAGNRAAPVCHEAACDQSNSPCGP